MYGSGSDDHMKAKENIQESMITAMTKIYLDEPKSCENDASSMEYLFSRDPSTLTSCGLGSSCRDRTVTKGRGPARLSKWRSSGGFCSCQ
jgi:hypothetical protein